VDLTNKGMGNHFLRDVHHTFRIYVRVCEEDGKTTNLSVNPVCLVFCPLTIGAKTLSLSITNEEYTVVSFPHIVTFSCPPSLPSCNEIHLGTFRVLDKILRGELQKFLRIVWVLGFVPICTM